MWQFIIAGYVPGTNFQITFEMVEFILICGLAGGVTYSVRKLSRSYLHPTTLDDSQGQTKNQAVNIYSIHTNQ